jgi:predicted DNA-binding transcriptional regulator YafY
MRHDKLERELKLMLLLIENHNYTVQDLCDRMELSRRNLYYYLDFFRDAGFIVEHHKPYYRLSKESPFFRKLDAIVHFTEDEAIALRQILEQTGDNSLQVQRLKQKLDKLYDLSITNDVELQEQLAHNVTTLYKAIKQRCTVVLKDYASAHSNSVSDRVVEPFLFMNGNREIRCYELRSGMNKTFKLSRIGEVQLLDLLWSNERHHRQMFTDVFMFSGEEQLPVSLRMGRLSMQLLREEYPGSARYLEPDGDSHWLLNMPVCSYIGIGRFVMGLLDDIEVRGGEDFQDYIRQKIVNYHQQIQTTKNKAT